MVMTPMKNIGPHLLSLVPLSFWHRTGKNELIIPHWHLASEKEIAHVSGLYRYRSCAEFFADLDYFSRNYKTVALGDILGWLDGRDKLPNRSAHLTFDDGFREIYDLIAPELYAKGIPATFFLTTSVIDNQVLGYPQKKSLIINMLRGPIKSTVIMEVERCLSNAGIEGSDTISRIRRIYSRDRHVLDLIGIIIGIDFNSYLTTHRPYLTSDQIKGLIKDGFSIGSHSIDHPHYSELSIEEQLYQTLESARNISSRFNYNCCAFAFPYTDRGITSQFFETLRSHNTIKATFGIGGIWPRRFGIHLSRFSMERTGMHARYVLARQFGRMILHR